MKFDIPEGIGDEPVVTEQDLRDFADMWRKCAHYWKKNYDNLRKEYNQFIDSVGFSNGEYDRKLLSQYQRITELDEENEQLKAEIAKAREVIEESWSALRAFYDDRGEPDNTKILIKPILDLQIQWLKDNGDDR